MLDDLVLEWKRAERHIDTVSIDGVIHYEERMLFTMMLLRHPRARLVYVTSQPLHPAMIDAILADVEAKKQTYTFE